MVIDKKNYWPYITGTKLQENYPDNIKISKMSVNLTCCHVRLNLLKR